MKNLIFFTIVILPILGYSQSQAIFNEMEFDYKGDIESVLIESFKPKTQNGQIIGFRYEGGLFGLGSQEIFFNKDGKVRLKYEYETTCGGDSIKIDKIWKYYYKNSKIESVIRSEFDTSLIRKGFRPWKFIYSYESDTVIYETSDLTIKRTSRITRTKNKRIREYLTKDSLVYLTEISTYDTLQRQVKFESYKDGALKSVTILNYKDENAKSANIIYKIDLIKNSVRRTEHQYNDNGDITKTTLFKPDGEYMTHWSFIY
jgi:hypothetical protein